MFKQSKYLLLLLSLLFTLNIASAQDVTEEPTAAPTAEVTPEATVEPPVDPPPEESSPLPDTTESPQDILRMIWATLVGGSSGVAGSLFVLSLVAVLKMFLPSSLISAEMLKNVVGVITWIVYSLAVQFGFGTEAQGIARFITPILVTGLPLLGVLVGSPFLYKLSLLHKVPIWGYKRPD